MIILIVFTSCKNTDKPIEENKLGHSLKEKVKDDIFKILINGVVKSDDIFEVFYTDIDAKEGFTEAKKLKIVVKGDDSIQNIAFNLPEEVLPYNFRIDIGSNDNQKGIIIQSISIEYNNKNIIIDKDSIHIFFDINEYIDYNKIDGRVRVVEVNGRKDPFIIAKPILLKKIEIEF